MNVSPQRMKDRARLVSATLCALLPLCCVPTHAAPRAEHGKRHTTAAIPPVQHYGADRADVQAFAEQLTQRHGFPENWVASQLAQARYLPRVAQLVMPPAVGTAKNWEAYRARFVEPQRIRAGLRWWSQHEAALRQAESRWGVPPELVVSIVGIETFLWSHDR